MRIYVHDRYLFDIVKTVTTATKNDNNKSTWYPYASGQIAEICFFPCHDFYFLQKNPPFKTVNALLLIEIMEWVGEIFERVWLYRIRWLRRYSANNKSCIIFFLSSLSLFILNILLAICHQCVGVTSVRSWQWNANIKWENLRIRLKGMMVFDILDKSVLSCCIYFPSIFLKRNRALGKSFSNPRLMDHEFVFRLVCLFGRCQIVLRIFIYGKSLVCFF